MFEVITLTGGTRWNALLTIAREISTFVFIYPCAYIRVLYGGQRSIACHHPALNGEKSHDSGYGYQAHGRDAHQSEILVRDAHGLNVSIGSNLAHRESGGAMASVMLDRASPCVWHGLAGSIGRNHWVLPGDRGAANQRSKYFWKNMDLSIESADISIYTILIKRACSRLSRPTGQQVGVARKGRRIRMNKTQTMESTTYTARMFGIGCSTHTTEAAAKRAIAKFRKQYRDTRASMPYPHAEIVKSGN